VIRFGGIELETSSHVMTPRSTSLPLVDRVVAHLDGRAGVVADVGTGSGALAIAIAIAAPETRVWATDVSPAAVELARANAARAGLADRVTVREGELLVPVPVRVDAIVANLPYLPLGERHRHPDLWREPADAVFAPGDGLGIVRRLLAAAPQWLTPDGIVVLQVRGQIVVRRPLVEAAA
jgi:release factor glutamine methyltransferase